jgi:Bacterial Ig-like domain
VLVKDRPEECRVGGKAWAALAACALTLLSLPLESSAVNYEPAPPFCDGAILHDYRRPFERMPKLHAPPPNGRVGFASGKLRLQPFPPLVVGEGEVGYTLGPLEKRAPVRLGWDVTTTLDRIDGRGRPIERIERARRHLAIVSRRRGGGARFQVGDEPALYRLTVVVRTETGRKLGGYGFYFRVLTPTGRVRLALNAAAFGPGETVFGRIENFGTALVSFGAPYAIERQDGSAWTKAPQSPPGPWILIAYIVGPGSASNCSGFWVPPGMPAGRYRMVKEVRFATRLPMTDPSPALVAAEFDLVP